MEPILASLSVFHDSFLAAPTALTKPSSYQWESNNWLIEQYLNTAPSASFSSFQNGPAFGEMPISAELPLFLLHCDRTFWKSCLLTSVHGVRPARSKMLVYQNRHLSHKSISEILHLLCQLCSTFRKSFFHWHVLKSLTRSVSWASCKASYKAQNSFFNYCYSFTNPTLSYTYKTSKMWVYMGLNLTSSSVRHSESWYQLQYEFLLFFCTAVKKLI